MYRSYENPYKLEKQLEELQERYARETDESVRVDLIIEIQEMKDRINFAWQDDEYDAHYDDN